MLEVSFYSTKPTTFRGGLFPVLCRNGESVTVLDEIQAEVWHILASIYTHQRLMESLSQTSTRYELANQLVALNALGEILVVRLARLADKRKDARSISMLLKRSTFSGSTASVKDAADRFLLLVEPVVKIRHERIAHMKPGTLSSYEPQDLPADAIKATEALVDLIDTAREELVSYRYNVGSMEPIIDLKASLAAGAMVAA